MLGFGALGELALNALRPGDSLATPSLFDQLLADPARARIYLMEAAPILTDGASGGALFLEDGSELFLEDGTSLDLQGSGAATKTLRYSTHGFNSAPTDTPANAHWDARLKQPLAFERSIMRAGALSTRAVPSVSEIELLNGDRGLDALLGYSWSGIDVTVKMGAPGFTYADFGTIAMLKARAVNSTEDVLSIAVRSRDALLDVPAQSDLYGGDGEDDGGDDLAGRPRPQAYGVCREVPAPLVEPGKLLYQVHDGAVEEFIAVKDNAVALTLDDDYATVALLRAASIAAGGYSTCLADGYFRIAGVGGKSSGQVTCDVKGATFDGSYVDDAATLMRAIVLAESDLTTDDLDDDSFTSLATAQAATVGLWIGPEQRTIADVLDELCVGIGATWSFTRQGKLSLLRLGAPSGAPAASFTRTEIQSIAPVPHAPPFDVPVQRVGVTWRRIYHVPPQDALAASVSAADRAYLAAERRVAVSEDTTIADTYLEAGRPAPIQALFDLEADASAEATRTKGLYDEPRRTWALALDVRPFARDLGEVVRVTYPAFGLDDGKLMVITGLADDAAAGQIAVEAWG